MRRRCLLLLILALTISTAYAASAQDDVWAITERCFGEPTAPPESWTFDGTLIMTSPGRLHTFQQGWETPRIVAFYRQDIPRSSAPDAPYSGVLSPDGRWYAVITGKASYGEVGSTFTTESIVIYSTTDDTKYIVPWEGSFYSFRGRLHGYGLYWLDNQHLLYPEGENQGGRWFAINPFTQSIEQWHSNLEALSQGFVLLTPDTNAIISHSWGYGLDWVLSRGEENITLQLWGWGAWSPDLQAFAAYIRDSETAEAGEFVLFNLGGNITHRLFQLTPETIPHNAVTKWSPNADYLLFATDRLYIADMNNRQVIDTCVSVNTDVRNTVTVAWSPSGTQFALLTNRRDDGIQIFHVETWGRYVVAYHSGDLIGWRADD